MNPLLSKLRAQIKRCEEFISLCDRIKQFEKLQDGSQQLKKNQWEAERLEVLKQLDALANERLALEARLSDTSRPIGLLEKEQLKASINERGIRANSLRLHADNLTKQIDGLEEADRNNGVELDQMYAKLEEAMAADGFDPNTARERLVELQRERDIARETIKAHVSRRENPNDLQAAQDEEERPPADGTPVPASAFHRFLLADFGRAKRSIEIFSPHLAGARALEIVTELAEVAGKGINAIVYTNPPDEQPPEARNDARYVITEAHRLNLTLIQRSGLKYNVAIVDNLISWEGNVSILGASPPKATMRRMSTSSHVRELKRFLSLESG